MTSPSDVVLTEDLVAELRSWIGFPKKELDVLLERAIDEIERLRVVFDEACNEVKVSHGTPCFCKYCHEETPK